MRSEIQTLGPLCTVDLFPVPIQANVKDLSDRQAPHTPPAHPPFPSAGPSHISHPAEQAHTIFTFVPNEYPTKQPSVEFLPLPSHCIPAFLPPPPSGAGIVRDVDEDEIDTSVRKKLLRFEATASPRAGVKEKLVSSGFHELLAGLRTQWPTRDYSHGSFAVK